MLAARTLPPFGGRPLWPAFLNSRLFLVSALTLMVLVLGWGVYYAVKRIDESTEAE